VTVEVAPTVWRLEGAPQGVLRARLREPASGLDISVGPGARGRRIEAALADGPLSQLVTVSHGAPLLDAGVATGQATVETDPDAVRFEADLQVRAARIASLRSLGSQEEPAFGPANDVRLRVAGRYEPAASRFSLAPWRVDLEGAAAQGALLVEGAGRDPRLDLDLEVERVDFGRLLASAGLERPQAVAGRAGGPPREGELGSASLHARFQGRLADAASFVVTQRLDFTPPRRTLPAIERLRGDFTHEVVAANGARRAIAVSAAAPDFIALADVPPLFVRTLLLGEDSSFFSHAGLDLSELPAAVLTNWARGQAARGGSTISQQLAKNLFLSRDKNMGRKLQELSLALLLEAGLGKQRILEIYLNVIEWGPDLYGLRPASRHYFGREPQDLTPAQMALLVALIPGPVKYQRSLARGRPSPGFRPLVDGLLAKLRSIDLLTEAEYEAARADEILLYDRGAPAEGASSGDTIPARDPSP
jgi:hypothetical protein